MAVNTVQLSSQLKKRFEVTEMQFYQPVKNIMERAYEN